MDYVESLRESGHGEAEAEVVNGKGLAVSRNSDLEADSRDLSSCYSEQALHSSSEPFAMWSRRGSLCLVVTHHYGISEPVARWHQSQDM